jgi:hypothetical protein
VNPMYGAGPSRVPCPDATNHVWQHGAWYRVHVRGAAPTAAAQQQQQQQQQRPTACATSERSLCRQPHSNKSLHRPHRRAPAVRTTREAGCTWDLSAILHGPSYTATMEAGGANLRGLLSTVARAAAPRHGEGVVMAIAALCMGRAQWMGQAGSSQQRHPCCLSGCPAPAPHYGGPAGPPGAGLAAGALR